MKKKIAPAERAIMFRCLRTLFEAGVPLHRACDILSQQLPHPALCLALQDVTRRLERGSSMADALTHHPACFGAVDINLIRVASRTGTLGAVLEQLALLHESNARLLGRTTAALIYPLSTLAVCLVMVVLGPPFLFRSLFEMLRQSGVALPWISRLLIGFSDLLRHPGFWLGALAAGAAMAALWRRLDPGWRRWRTDQLLQNLYLIGPVVRLQAVTRFARALAVTARSGVPIQEGVRLAASSSGSPVLEQVCTPVRQSLIDGLSLSEGLQKQDYFPRLFLMTLVAGEESGHFSDSLDRSAQIYELELECRVEALADALGPVVTALVGGVAAVVNLATLMPLLRLIESL